MKWILLLVALLLSFLGGYVVKSRMDVVQPEYKQDIKDPVIKNKPTTEDNCEENYRRAMTDIKVKRDVKAVGTFEYEINILASDTFKSTEVHDKFIVNSNMWRLGLTAGLTIEPYKIKPIVGGYLFHQYHSFEYGAHVAGRKGFGLVEVSAGTIIPSNP